MPELFNKRIINSYLDNYSIDNYKDKINVINNWKRQLQIIKRLNEKELQAAFLKGIFGKVLGYKGVTEIDENSVEWNLKIEASTEIDASIPDGILGFYNENKKEDKNRVVIELKGPQVSLDEKQYRSDKNYGTPVDQAFSYTSKIDNCQWVVVSNMLEIRLYKMGRSQSYYEVFYLDELDQENNFKKFHMLLSKDNLIKETGKSFTQELSEETVEHTESISTSFYNDFKITRIDLFEHLKKHNLTIEKEVLLEKAQKFLDRIIFIAFCEDIGLLPNDLLHKAIEAGKHSFSTDDETIWSQIKGVFSSIDKGNPQHNINAYNGGLFKKDDILDSLKIKNNFFNKIDKLSAYDFDSDVDVNILGHIFEQSISDIEDIKANIRNEDYDKNESKRKKDGIYYTPPYITKFIIEEAIGKYLQEIKDKLGYNNLPEIEENRSPQLRGKYIKKHIEFYNKYEEKLSNIKILDPACGSGAFLNQAFDYLLIEYQWIHKQISLIKEGQTSIFGIKSLHRDILKNNLFGVDLNAESVEITKLSLWLKTANKNKPLTNLDDNIKCGNSLINDTFIVGDKAFLWEQEFPEVINEGGFDIVIGNPPYVRQEEIKWMKDFLKKNYKIYDGKADLYTYFFEKGIELLKDNGYFSIIVSNKFTRAKYGEMLRKYLLNQSIISYIDFTGKKIFKDAEVDSCIITIKKAKPSNNHIFKFDNDQSIKQSQLNTERWSFLSLEELSIKNKVEKIGVPLYEWDININNGIKTGYNEAFIIDEETKDMLISKDEKNSKVIKPMLRGEDISRYSINFNNLYILATGYDIDIPHDYPVIYTYLKEHKERAEKRYDQGKNWWNLRACSYYDDLDKNKIIWPDISNIPSFYLDTQGYWLRTTSYFMIGSELEYINALLNSKLIDYIYKRFYSGGSLGKGTRYKKDFLLQVPMVKAEKNIKSNIKDYVSLMYKFKTKLETLNKIRFINVVNKYASIENNISIFDIVNQSGYKYEVYSGRAQKIRNFTVNINDNIITIYTDKSGNEKYELVKFEVDNYNKRQYIKVYLENLSEDKLEDINNRYSGNILEKLIQIKIPDYTVDHVVEKVINEWEKINNEINLLYKEVEQIDRKLNKIIYQLYELTEDEIKIVKNSN